VIQLSDLIKNILIFVAKMNESILKNTRVNYPFKIHGNVPFHIHKRFFMVEKVSLGF